MTTAALIKEIRERNKELVAGMEETQKILGQILETQKEILAATKTLSQPQVASNQQKVK